MLYRSQHKRTKYPISHPFTHSFRRWGEGSKIFRSPQNGLNHDLPSKSKFKAAFSHRAAAGARHCAGSAQQRRRTDLRRRCTPSNCAVGQPAAYRPAPSKAGRPRHNIRQRSARSGPARAADADGGSADPQHPDRREQRPDQKCGIL